MKVIVMRGPSGAGKSTYVMGNFPDAVICSADNYWLDGDGNYNFDVEKLHCAHMYCKGLFLESLKSNEDLIVVDNTNIRTRDYKYYIDLALEYGYNVEVHEMDFKDEHVELFQDRNAHDVPSHVVERMASGFSSCLRDDVKVVKVPIVKE